MEENVPAVRRHAAVLVTVVVGLVVVLILLYSIGGVFADRKRSRMLGAWADTLGSFERFLERYPEREANESALRVEELSAALGIDLAPRGAEDRPRPAGAAAESYKQAKRAVNDYADDQLESATSSVGPPPEAAVLFLREQTETLGALRRQLTEAEAPRWALRLSDPYGTPLPNLIGHSNLQRLLLADALYRASAGDHPGALTTLDGSWRLNSSLRETPILMAQLIALGIARQQLGALRRIEGVPRSWRDRIHEHDYRAAVFKALQLEGWDWFHALDPKSVEESDTIRPSLLHSITRPYVSLCVTGVGDEWRRRLVQLSEVGSYCDRDLAAAAIDLELKPPAWNLLGRITFGSLDDVPRRVARYELDLEMTAKLLDLQRAREELGGRWPESLPGIEHSRICPDDSWLYEAVPGGEASLAFSRDVEWTGLRGIRLPLRYVAKPREGTPDRPRR